LPDRQKGRRETSNIGRGEKKLYTDKGKKGGDIIYSQL
jgi:hypothetical protein